MAVAKKIDLPRSRVSSIFKFIIVFVCIRIASFAYKIYTSNEDPVLNCAWKMGEHVDLFIYSSDQSIQSSFVSGELVVELKGLKFDKKFTAFSKNFVIPTAKKYAHVYMTRAGVHPDPDISGYRPLDVVYKRTVLIGSSKENSSQVFLYPEVRIDLVTTDQPIPLSPLTKPFVTVDFKTQQYLPIIYSYDHWRLSASRDFLFVKSNPHTLVIRIGTMTFNRFRIMSLLGVAIDRNEQLVDVDHLKEMISETAPWLLTLTLLVTVLHCLFDFLAFKNDVSYWGKGDLHGMSSRTVLISGGCQVVVLLYLIDQKANSLVIGSTFIGLLVDIWKLRKIGLRTHKKTKTEEYDAEAIKWLSLVLLPCCFAYSAYAYRYQRPLNHSLYSFALATAVGFVYSFGFVLMTPQLFINYKLKSVAHMPWRSFTYKALNTFIDDLFAFVIKMPTLHRVACFRDDLLFCVYLYQRWIYPVDGKRMNEYGQLASE